MSNTTHINKRRLLDLYVSFINSFDGSPAAFAAAEPIMEQIFDPSLFVFLTDEGPKDLAWYADFAESFAESGNVARVTSIESTEAGIRVTIENRVGGVDIEPITYDGAAVADENGDYKLTYFAPTTVDLNHHIKNVGKMVRLVDECANNANGTVDSDDETITFVCKMELVKGRAEEFKQHARKAAENIEATESNDTLSFNIICGDTTCHTLERYRDSHAAAKHILNMRKNLHRNAAITNCSNVTVLEVYGNADKELKALLNGEDYDVAYFNQMNAISI
ncbi:hypothetical protein ACHAWF_014959 [Thalassiosira exigua]